MVGGGGYSFGYVHWQRNSGREYWDPVVDWLDVNKGAY
jgi:hypothetical protein